MFVFRRITNKKLSQFGRQRVPHGNKLSRKQLTLQELAMPTPGPDEVLIKIGACGVCRTDLHIVDGELTEPKLPLIPGHQIVGIVEGLGAKARRFKIGERVGVPWLGGACGQCRYCKDDRENLCDEPLDAAIIFAPVGALVPAALKAVRKGGTVVCADIHMSDIPGFPYKDHWEERVIRSVANLTRQDGTDFLALAPRIPIQTEITVYPLENANEALADLRNGNLNGSAVLGLS